VSQQNQQQNDLLMGAKCQMFGSRGHRSIDVFSYGKFSNAKGTFPMVSKEYEKILIIFARNCEGNFHNFLENLP